MFIFEMLCLPEFYQLDSFMRFFTTIITAAFLLNGCANNHIKRTEIDQFVEVIYATVENTTPVQFNSNADEAAVVGGIEGVIENSDGNSKDMLEGAFIGAAISALFVSIEEGSNEGLLLELRSNDDTLYNFSTKLTDIQVNDCLKIIKGIEVSLDKVTTDYCH